MKTQTNKHTKSGLKVRPDEQRSENNSSTPQPALATTSAQQKPARILPFVNYAEREANRSLSTDRVLEILRRWMPKQYALAEIVGKWIWITFPEPPPEQVRGELSQFGFHWNNARKCWQHPCGQFATEGSGQDPREKYGSRMATAA
jgi:hypothetical protein